MLSKILSGWLTRSSKNDEKSRINNLPKHEQARLAVEKLSIRKGRPFNPIRASSVELHCINPNILSFSKRIEGCVEKLQSGKSLTPSDCFSEFKVVNLDEFFTDENGLYIPLSTLEDFLDHCRQLFAIIEKRLNNKDRDIEYSIRLLGKYWTSIQNVCKAVDEATA